GFRSTWTSIVHEVKKLQNQCVNIFDYIRIKIGNGDNTSFWKDKWHNKGVLKDVFPRLYALERHQNITIHTKLIDYSLVNSFLRNPRSGVEEFQLDNLSRLVSTITLSSAVDRYVWSLENSGEFSVKSIRQVIDANCFPVIHSATRWVKSVPLKVNIMAWKIKMDGLPTRMNISRRGIEIDSIVCPICNSGAESSCHIFFQCNLVRQLARKISSWWNVDYVDVSSYEEWYTWLVSLRLQANLKAVARVRSKEQCDGLINQVNQKSVEISDLNAKLQKQGLVITALKNELRKLKGKDLVENVVMTCSVDLAMPKIDMEPITPKLLNKRTAHSAYIKNTQEEAVVLRDIIEHVKANYPQDPALESAFRLKPSGNTKNDKIQRPPSSNLKNKVEAYPRKVKSSLNKQNGIVKLNGSACVHHSKLNENSERICIKCDNCLSSDNHSKVFTNVRYSWRPTGKTFTLVGTVCPLTGITTTIEVPHRKPIILETKTPKPVVTLVYSRKPMKNKITGPASKPKVVQIVMWYLDSGFSKHMTEDRSQLTNFINKFLEGLGHNLFSVEQFCDSNLEVAFRQHTCYIRNLEGIDLLTESRGDNLYTLSLGDMMTSSPICLLSKASKTKSWLWHRRLSHLNFRAINHLARHGLV
ncbi:integrase, catalytic region, zinc finger, CCHC-type containing protein, partial [Tanacetum coccineum]